VRQRNADDVDLAFRREATAIGIERRRTKGASP
jgi:hypothetical protein